jgi:hypothetical protein
MCCDPARCDGALGGTLAAHSPSCLRPVLIPLAEFETPAGFVRRAVPPGALRRAAIASFPMPVCRRLMPGRGDRSQYEPVCR